MEDPAAAVVEEVEEAEGRVCSSSSFEDSEPSVYALCQGFSIVALILRCNMVWFLFIIMIVIVVYLDVIQSKQSKY